MVVGWAPSGYECQAKYHRWQQQKQINQAESVRPRRQIEPVEARGNVNDLCIVKPVDFIMMVRIHGRILRLIRTAHSGNLEWLSRFIPEARRRSTDHSLSNGPRSIQNDDVADDSDKMAAGIGRQFIGHLMPLFLEVDQLHLDQFMIEERLPQGDQKGLGETQFSQFEHRVQMLRPGLECGNFALCQCRARGWMFRVRRQWFDGRVQRR